MLDKFRKYYQENELFTKTDKVLLTVSGGKDSMAMLNLFIQQNLSFGVAHCNFELRGEEAEKDQEFVRQFCEVNGLEFHTKAFQTKEYATKNGISIQMAARDLRYNWFEKIREENAYQYIATAHHKNDVAETMLINLTKGTGLSGLHGISNKNGKIIRPLLCFNSIEIGNYVKENDVAYREDASNADTKYTRNSIRHKVIPELEKMNPAFIETANTEAEQFLELEEILNQKIKEEQSKLFVKTEYGFKIEIESLKKLTPLKTYLFYFLRTYNFNAPAIADIIEGLEGQSGKTFYSATHQIVKDRTHLLLSELKENTEERIEVNSIEELPFNVRIIDDMVSLEIEKSNQYAYLDADKIQFPMVLRTWKQGDTFKPFGMKGNKKVSDFLIDNKVSIVEKKTIKVLVSGNDIVWLVGQRISDNFKITEATIKGLVLSQKD